MSWGAVPAELILDYARSQGCYHQLELDLGCPIWVFVDPKYLTSEQEGYRYFDEKGQRMGLIGSTDHPYFTRTREWLHNNGWIEMETSWSNGDRVLKPFYFNNVLLDKGEQFSCGCAMGYGRFVKNYNDGEPDYSLKNYIEDDDDWINEDFEPLDDIDDEEWW